MEHAFIEATMIVCARLGLGAAAGAPGGQYLVVLSRRATARPARM